MRIEFFSKSKIKGRKGFLSLATFLGFFFIFIIYITTLYPIIQDNINNISSTADPLTKAGLTFLPLAFLFAIVIGLFIYATSEE